MNVKDYAVKTAMKTKRNGRAQPNAIVTIFLLKEGKRFVAYCPDVEVCGYGDSQQEALRSFKIDMEVFLEETKRKGTFEKLLLAYGWTLRQIPAIQYTPPNKHLSNDDKAGTKLLKEIQFSMPISESAC